MDQNRWVGGCVPAVLDFLKKSQTEVCILFYLSIKILVKSQTSPSFSRPEPLLHIFCEYSCRQMILCLLRGTILVDISN